MRVELEQQLIKTQQELSALKAEYEEFAYIVSHDLSAPLRQIEGFAEIIATKHADTFDDKTKRHLALIQNGSIQAKNILDALLEYSRLNSTTTPFILFDCNQVLDEVKQKLTSSFSDIDMIIKNDKLPSIKGNKVQFSLLLEHLIHNALHYQLLDNKPNIVISAVEVDGFWQFCVTDNGIGFSDNLMEKIFKVLRRGVSDKKYSGIGMGLAVARKIVQKHGGCIWAATTKEEGSSFFFTIKKD